MPLPPTVQWSNLHSWLRASSHVDGNLEQRGWGCSAGLPRPISAHSELLGRGNWVGLVWLCHAWGARHSKVLTQLEVSEELWCFCAPALPHDVLAHLKERLCLFLLNILLLFMQTLCFLRSMRTKSDCQLPAIGTQCNFSGVASKKPSAEESFYPFYISLPLATSLIIVQEATSPIGVCLSVQILSEIQIIIIIHNYLHWLI